MYDKSSIKNIKKWLKVLTTYYIYNGKKTI